MLDAVLTHPPPLVAVILCVFSSVFAIGLWCGHWLEQVDLAAYRSLNVFTDNIKSENLLKQMSNGLPIDVVYTWVNGTDPDLIQGLQAMASGFQDSCPLSHCVSAPYISLLEPTLSKSFLLSIPSIIEVGHHSISHNSNTRNFTIVRILNENSVGTVMSKLSEAVGNHSQPRQAYWTSDVGGGWGVKQRHAALVTGGTTIPHVSLLKVLFPQHPDITSVCTVSEANAVQVVECRDEDLISHLLQTAVNSDGLPETLKVRQAMLMLQPDKEDQLKEVDVNRFVDNEELRYSLRSLEKYAPWVRKIFLVTNGQIPYWLNLDHSRLTIITHDQIFVNKSDLPTYSSPAIESHIHRIPGLSEHFLYLNDDVMLGSEVWPDDFYSPSTGYKVYLSWSLPECSSGCPGSWLGDGYCDTSCNTSACEWDGGDCTGGKGDGAGLDMDYDFGVDDTPDFCAPSCSDLWLADKYCDHACNVPACGYDGGDCGVENMRKLHELAVPTSSNITYILPKGISMAWMNISTLLMPNKTIDGRHTEHGGVRSLAVNTAQKVLFIFLKNNLTTTLQLEFNISSKDHSEMYFLTMKWNTIVNKTEVDKVTKNTTEKPVIVYKNYTYEEVSPKVLGKKLKATGTEGYRYGLVNVNSSNLPQPLVQAILHLETLLRDGELTQNGFKRKKSGLISKFMEENVGHELVFNQKYEFPDKGKTAEQSPERKSNEVNTSRVLKENINQENKTKTYMTHPKVHETKELNQYKNSRHLLWSPLDDDYAYMDSEEEGDGMGKLHPNKEHEAKNVSDGTIDSYKGNLPWEKEKLFNHNLFEVKRLPLVSRRFQASKRHLLDMFAESLLHVNRLYNSEFGYQARRVPAHMPHFISKSIIKDLQDRFSEEFQLTSSHKIRQANDMQYAFSYFYFLMSRKRTRTVEEVFRSFDTDNSGTLSDREIRNFLTRSNDLPLYYSSVQAFHRIVTNCSNSIETQPVPTPVYERYTDSDLPTVSLELVLKCEDLSALMKKMEKVNYYKYTHQSEDVVHFKMVTSNVSVVVHMLDEVRKNPRKFICLNSNIDPRSKDNDLIHALVQDMYESLFPVPSSFELPLNYRNRFLYVRELQAWRKWRDFIRALIYACLTSLIVLTLINFFSTELESLRRKWCRRRRRRDGLGGIRV